MMIERKIIATIEEIQGIRDINNPRKPSLNKPAFQDLQWRPTVYL